MSATRAPVAAASESTSCTPATPRAQVLAQLVADDRIDRRAGT